MTLIVCVDQKNGILFNHRRQSQDRMLRERICTLCDTKPLRLSSYSAKQFPDTQSTILQVDDTGFANAPADAVCFAECAVPPLQLADKLILYRWNRIYPADVRLPVLTSEWILRQCTDFPGYSHEIITEEIYTK